ncbi:hypothetical protein EDD11_007042 [Mortierella claussenii]|nr:hypothetical protein EDD11_007042 [Mortierella claussenii]
MSSDLRARLLDLGFSLSQARAAVEAGNSTVEGATEWIFDNTDKLPAGSGIRGQDTLRLRGDAEEEDAFEADLQKALAASSQPQPPATLLATAPASFESSTTDTSDNITGASAAKKIKINIIRNSASAQQTTTAPLPLTSRHKEEEQMALNAARVAEANKRAEQVKKDKRDARLARQRALDDLKQDRENRKLRTHVGVGSSAGSGASGGQGMANDVTPRQTTTSAVVPASHNVQKTLVQLRLKNGSVVKRSFESNATLKDLFELARSEDGNIGSAAISLIQPFPRREFTVADSALTLLAGGLCPSCSLNVFVQAPIPAPQPITPGARLPTAVEIEELVAVHDQDAAMEAHNGDDGEEAVDVEEEDDNEEEDDEEDQEHDEGQEGDNDEDMMHALPMPLNPPLPARWGRGTGRESGLSFSGAGHSLGSSASLSSTADPGQAASDAAESAITAESDAARRQRILDAMASRASDQIGQRSQFSGMRLKKKVERIVPSLQSICSYEVAVMLTAKDAKSSKYLKLLGDDVGSQVAEGIVRELIKLKQLDQLTFRRLYRCTVVNMVLDAYSRATDSLMDSVGASQSRSLAYLSLKECTFLTDRGFSNVARFEELEYLDLSRCRVTDKTLEFTLNLPHLCSLHLTGTKITSRGLARVISEATWKSTLQTLDVSYCQGISGRYVLVNLQELLNIRTLKLNNTAAFNDSPLDLPNPDAFTKLLDLDMARTALTDNDLLQLIPSLKTVQTFNLTACANIGTSSLMACVRALPLTHLDLTGFLYVTDEAILSLSAAVNLELLSLAGTRLTDAGSSRLNLGFDKYIHDEALSVFTKSQELTTLNLEYTDVTEMQALRLQDSMPNLKQLRLQGVTNGSIYEEEPQPRFD